MVTLLLSQQLKTLLRVIIINAIIVYCCTMLIIRMYCGYSPPRDDYLHVYTGKVLLVRPGIDQILSLLALCSLLVRIIHHAVMCIHVPVQLYNMNDVKSL